MDNGPSVMRWTRDEWQAIAGAALPHIEAGLPDLKALYKAQKFVLPRARQRSEDDCEALLKRHRQPSYVESGKTSFADHIAEARRIDSGEPRSGPQAAKPAPKNIPIPKPSGGPIRWSPLEWAKMAREVKRMQDAGDTRNLGRMICEAQLVVISPYRYRAESGIMQGNYKGENQRRLEKGWIDATSVYAKETSMMQPAPPAAAPAPAAPAQVIEMVTRAPEPPAPPPKAPEAPPVASAAPVRTTPPRESFGFAMEAFAKTLEGALEVLLSAHAEHIYSTIDSRLLRATDQIAAAVAAQIGNGLRKVVLDTMAEELGGPVQSVTPPDTPPPPPPAPPPSTPPQDPGYSFPGPSDFAAARAAAVPVVYKGQPLRMPSVDEMEPVAPEDAQKLIVDVIGLKGVQPEEVRRAFNGHTSLRFVEADHVRAWIPRRGAHVVVDTKFVSHDAELKCARYRIKPQRVKGGAGAVIHAIEALHQAEGIEQ
jgi:hypothetical protein